MTPSLLHWLLMHPEQRPKIAEHSKLSFIGLDFDAAVVAIATFTAWPIAASTALEVTDVRLSEPDVEAILVLQSANCYASNAIGTTG